MQINETINTITNYIEDNLTEEIDMKKLSKLVGINEFILSQLFSLVCNISISSYIRARRLSKSVYDLIDGQKVIEVAINYGYESASSFSRAFYKFHGIMPSKIKSFKGELKNYPIIHLDKIENNQALPYKIVTLEDKILYGKCVKSDEVNINNDAPAFWQKMNKSYKNKYGNIDYGAVVTLEEDDGIEQYEYWILYDKKIPEFQPFKIPESKYLVFRIDRVEAEDIQAMCNQVFNFFLPSTNYTFKYSPELEHYHDQVVDYYVPIN